MHIFSFSLTIYKKYYFLKSPFGLPFTSTLNIFFDEVLNKSFIFLLIYLHKNIYENVIGKPNYIVGVAY
jgi:hypothetical protein